MDENGGSGMKRLESRKTNHELASKMLYDTRKALNTYSVYRGFILMEFCEDGSTKVATHLQYNTNWRGSSDTFQYGDLMEDTAE
jgi:hypothetical protein